MKPVKVSQLNQYISRLLQTDPILGNVSVTGEISNLKYHSSGHIYFSLKDERSTVRCFFPDRYASLLRYELDDGMEVVVTGYVSVYERGGSYSVNVKDVTISGEGELMASYRALYDRLEKEGLFRPENKKALPSFPRHIFVITSPTGAAVQDILKIIRTRNDLVRVTVYPCLVQGDRAAGEIAEAIRRVNERFPDTDLIITGRGGGSLEELWAFNEEKVARAIYESKIPVISAVGHETDFSISDYAADRRAETPTAAAVMAVPDTRELRRESDQYLRYIREQLQRICHRKEVQLEDRSPAVLRRSLQHVYALRREQLQSFQPSRLARELRRMTERKQLLADQLADRLQNGMEGKLQTLDHELEKQFLRLDANDPGRIMERGYGIICSEDGTAISNAVDLKEGQRLHISMRDGRVAARVEEITGEE